MKTPTVVLVLLLAVPGWTGCGGKPAAKAAGGAGGASSVPATSAFDAGPRAGETPIDESRVEAGEKLFQTKGCTACHGWGQRMSGPDLKGVTQRRTAQWMENQILRPDKMAKEDPIARDLMMKFALQMPNQGLTPEEARAVIEYLKHRDHETGDSGEK